MASLDVRKFESDLVSDEGRRNKPYFDTEGFVTFGIGRNLSARPFNEEERAYGKLVGFESDEFVRYIFERDRDNAIRDLQKVAPWFTEHPEPVQRALANMSFQLGEPKLRLFSPSLSLIAMRRYREAGLRLRRSLWAKQTPRRAHEVISLIESCQV